MSSQVMTEICLQTLVIDNETTIFLMTTDYEGLSQYEQVKTLYKFMKNETKVLENCIETHLRHILSKYGIIPQSNDKNALNSAFNTLKAKRRRIVIEDRYENVRNSTIMGISPNHMTVVLDEGELSCAIEVREESI